MGSRIRLAALLAAAAMLACTSDDTFECQTNEQCAGEDAMCQPSGYCSFPDPACDSGQRYGDLAGGLSGQCVVDEGMPTSGAASTSSVGSTSTSGTGSDATTAGDDDASSSDATTTSGSQTGSTSDDPTTSGGPGCWVEDFEDDLLGSTWEAWVDRGVQASMGSGEAELELAETPGYGGMRTTFTLDVTGATATWVFDTLPELDQSEVYEVLLVGAQGAVRVEIGFGSISGYWDTQADGPNLLFSEPAPPGDLVLVQLTHSGASLSLTVVDDDDQLTDVITFDPPAAWDPTEQAIEFRAGATLAKSIPGALLVDLASVCQ